MTARWHLAALCAAIAAGPANARQDRQFWWSAQAGGALAGPVEGSVEWIQRHGDDADGRYQRIAVAMLGYRLAKDAVVQAGYVDSRNYAAGARTALERRLRQQVTAVVARPFGGALHARLRAEQRWREDQRGTGWRLRPQLRYSHALTGTVSSFVSHESFLNLDATPWGQRAGWERMRNAVGLQAPIGKAVRAELGYLHQYMKQRGDDENAHALTLGLALGW